MPQPKLQASKEAQGAHRNKILEPEITKEVILIAESKPTWKPRNIHPRKRAPFSLSKAVSMRSNTKKSRRKKLEEDCPPPPPPPVSKNLPPLPPGMSKNLVLCELIHEDYMHVSFQNVPVNPSWQEDWEALFKDKNIEIVKLDRRTGCYSVFKVNTSEKHRQRLWKKIHGTTFKEKYTIDIRRSWAKRPPPSEEPQKEPTVSLSLDENGTIIATSKGYIPEIKKGSVEAATLANESAEARAARLAAHAQEREDERQRQYVAEIIASRKAPEAAFTHDLTTKLMGTPYIWITIDKQNFRRQDITELSEVLKEFGWIDIKATWKGGRAIFEPSERGR
jgi:hypothetical protein